MISRFVEVGPVPVKILRRPRRGRPRRDAIGKLAAALLAKARNYHPDRYRHWWIPLDEVAFDEDLTLPSGRTLTAILRDDGRIYLGLGGQDLLLHTEDADHIAAAIDTQLNLDPGQRDDQTILTSTGDLELEPHGDGLRLRRIDPDARSAEAAAGNMVWTLPDDDAEAISELLTHMGGLQRAEPTSLHRVSDDLAWTLLSSGAIAPILGGASTPEPVTLHADEARALADALAKLRKKKIPVTTGSGVKGLRALLGGRKKADHTEAATLSVGRARVGWWSDGLVTVEVGSTEVQLTAADVADTIKALREMAGRSQALLGKWLGVALTKRARDLDPSRLTHYHGWIPRAWQAGRWTPIPIDEFRGRREAEEYQEIKDHSEHFGVASPDSYMRDMAHRIVSHELPPGTTITANGPLRIVNRRPDLVSSPAVRESGLVLDSLHESNPLPEGLAVVFKGEQSDLGAALSTPRTMVVFGPHQDPYERPFIGDVGNLMMEAREHPRLTYTLTHEYGHVLMMQRGHSGRAQQMFTIWRDRLSLYGRTDYKEAYAEMFAGFHLSAGMTDDSAVLAYAEEFGWNPPTLG